MDTLTTNINHITAGLSLNYILSAFLFLFLAIFLVKLVRYWRRAKGDLRQPQISFKYWLKDNWVGILIHLFLAVITVRFTSQIVELMGEKINTLLGTNSDPMYIYLIIGFNFQVLLDLIQKFGRKD